MEVLNFNKCSKVFLYYENYETVKVENSIVHLQSQVTTNNATKGGYWISEFNGVLWSLATGNPPSKL